MLLWLKAIREENGATQKTVAQKAQISQQYYSKIESGNQNASVRTAKAIAQVLGFSWQKFFE